MESVGCGVGSVESSPSFWLTKMYVSPDFVNTTVLSLYPSALITTVFLLHFNSKLVLTNFLP